MRAAVIILGLLVTSTALADTTPDTPEMRVACAHVIKADRDLFRVMGTPSKSTELVEAVQSVVDNFGKCAPLVPGASMTELAPVRTWLATSRDKIAGEAVCYALSSRVQVIGQIARERANPSGVVDLRELHKLGQMLQSLDEQLPGIKAEYARTQHHAFDAAVCK